MQSSIAVETLQVFAPLAKLLGMYQIKVDPYALAQITKINSLVYSLLSRLVQ